MSDSFLGRWSRRKLDVREGKPVDEPTPKPVLEGQADATNSVASYAYSTRAKGQIDQVNEPSEAVQSAAEPVQPPTPTLADAEALKPESDFKPFMARGVTPEVKNAAVKKLFADPRFNVMDGMDVYVDDYSVSTPIPQSVLRQMASAKFLGLFDEEEKREAAQAEQDAAQAAGQARDVPDGVAPPDVPQSAALPVQAEDPTNPNDHTDLRLQPNHAAGAQTPGPGAG